MIVRTRYRQVPVNKYIAFDDTVFDSEALVRLYNGLMTICEPCLGAGAMEIGVDWRSRK